MFDTDESESEHFWDEKTSKYVEIQPAHDYIIIVAITYHPPDQYTSAWYEDTILLLYNGPRILRQYIIEFVGTVDGLDPDWMDLSQVRSIVTKVVTKAGDR